MIFYLMINTCITLLAMALLKFTHGSNNVNYSLTVFALSVWLLPYPVLAEILSSNNLVSPVILSQTFTTISQQQDNLNRYLIDYQQLCSIALFACFLIGFCIFATRLKNQLSRQAIIKSSKSFRYCSELSEQYKTSVYRADNVPSGMLMGIFTSKIVVANAISQPNQLALIINHEKTHQTRKDNLRLMLLTLMESLFWWNPLVKKLSAHTRFYIEALCDEQCAKHYGQTKYQHDFAELILRNHQSQNLAFNCTATSNKNNNIQRLKRLKEQREMTIKSKLAYTLTITTALLLMAWHTVALATPNKEHQPNDLGALVNFELNVTDRTDTNQPSIHSSKMAMWVNFDEKAAFKISDKFHFNFKVSERSDVADVEIEILEVTASGRKIVEKPKLSVAFNQQAKIEIDNYQLSENAYSISFVPSKAKKPE